MTINFYHGEATEESFRAFTQALMQACATGAHLIRAEGKPLQPGELTQLAQTDFFATPAVIALTNLFARPKSKAREAIIAEVKSLPETVYWWEGKKVTPTTLKLITGAKISLFTRKENIWRLLASLSPANHHQLFATLYEQTLAEASQKSSSEPALYLLATLIWQVQQLLDAKDNNFHGIPFQRASIQTQAQKFTRSNLVALHQDLVALDARAKSGGLKLTLAQELFLRLEKI